MTRNDVSSSSSGGGISLLGAIQLILIILKLFNLIDWSWKMVLIPLWIVLVALLFIIALAIVASVE